MKIVSSGRGIHSPEFYKKKQKAKHIKFALSVLAVLAFLTLVVFFFRWEKFIVNEIVIAEEIAVDREEIMSVVESELAGYYLYVIPRGNTFLYRRGVITAEERKPYALYCIEINECFFLDENGFIFALAPSFSDGVYFTYKTEQPIETPMGESLLLENDFRELTKFLNTLPNLGISSLTLNINENDYNLVLNSGGKIIWKKEANLALIYSNLEAFLSDEAIKSQPDFLDKILHLDLRTENKVFYKFK